MKISIKKGSENYTAQVIGLPKKVAVSGLDNLVQVTHLGNNCLIQKDSDAAGIYLFFPAGAVLDPKFLFNNNLFRHGMNNLDSTKTGFFDDSGRVKSIKFKGVISTGFIIPVVSLGYLINPSELKIGDSFTDIDGNVICSKYVKKQRGFSSGAKIPKFDIETLVAPKFAPEHTDTHQLLKNSNRLSPASLVTITYKLHGTSIRVFHTKTKRKLGIVEKCLKSMGLKIQDHEYSYLVGSRRVIKSNNFRSLTNKTILKNDLWTMVARNNLEGKLLQGEAVYGEIVGADFTGAAIQLDYSYGFPGPKLFIYRITQINAEGFEIDLSWQQVQQRAEQLGIDTVPQLYSGRLNEFLQAYQIPITPTEDSNGLLPALEAVFCEKLLEQPSILDRMIVEEGFVIRQENYPRVTAYKIKSRSFQLHESKLQDKDIADVEENN